jgi:hypothetical protein
MPKLGPYSRPDALSKMDGRTWEAKLLRQVRDDLAAQLGGSPSAAQRALIDQASWLTLHVEQINRRTIGGKLMTEHDSRHYLAWTNALSRTLRHLGLKGVAQQPPSLKDYLAQRQAAAS